MVTELAEVLLAQAEQGRAVELGVPSHPVVRVRMEVLALDVLPDLLGLVLAVEIDLAGIPGVLLARHVVAPLDEEDAHVVSIRRQGKERARRPTVESASGPTRYTPRS